MKSHPGLILDTDMGNDIDDALALVMLHDFQRQGACQLLGVSICKDNPWAADYTRLVNARCGHAELPVGRIHDGPTPEDGNYIRPVSQAAGTARQPCEESTRFLRRLLAHQPRESVVLVSIGFFTNLTRLLNSPPDEISPLSGHELIARTVDFVCAMAGNFRSEPGVESSPDIGNPEFNVRTDSPSARHFIDHCPRPIVFSGFEVGASVLFSGSEIEKVLAKEPSNPVAAAYAAYAPMPYDRPTWDQTAVLYAVYPDAQFFDISPSGSVHVDAEGHTDFRPKQGGRHRHLILASAQRARVLDAITRSSTSFP